MKKLIGQHMIIGLSGPTLTEDEKKFICENNIGGVILFNRNIVSPEQLHDLCADIQQLRHKLPDKTPLFISIDMEGGRVLRLKAPFTPWPALKNVGDLDSPTVAFNFTLAMGTELRMVGINLDFAPCVDVLTNPQNTVIGDRSLSNKVDVVSKLASALVRGYLKSGILTCAKHFPGHGNTLVDSHLDLPIENETDLKRLDEIELQPFKKAFRARLDMVMTAHIKFPKIDAENPVTFSPLFLKEILEKNNRYRGLIISDDLDMGALCNHYDKAEIPIKALAAGVHILLYCNDPNSPQLAIPSISKAISSGVLNKSSLELSYKKILDLKAKRLTNPIAPNIREAKNIIGCDRHLALAEAIRQGIHPPKELLGQEEAE